MQAEVLAVLRRRGRPSSAYDILRELSAAHPKIAPPTIYKALSGLTKSGQVHRVESLKAYVVCQCGSHSHASILSICDVCGKVEENVAPKLLEELASIVGVTGFDASDHVIEVRGTCAGCRSR